MAVDVKSRAKRYEKLDFLGEGQVSDITYFELVLVKTFWLVFGLIAWTFYRWACCIVNVLQYSLQVLYNIKSQSKEIMFCHHFAVRNCLQSKRQNYRQHCCHQKGKNFTSHLFTFCYKIFVYFAIGVLFHTMELLCYTIPKGMIHFCRLKLDTEQRPKMVCETFFTSFEGYLRFYFNFGMFIWRLTLVFLSSRHQQNSSKRD